LSGSRNQDVLRKRLQSNCLGVVLSLYKRHDFAQTFACLTKKPATRLKDVARTLGVSISTVARALADHPQIGEITKARVRVAAGKLGYVAHSAARAMRRGHTNLIGLAVPDIQNEFYGALAKGLAQRCGDEGYQLLLAVTEDDPVAEERQVRALAEAGAAGIVLVASPAPRRETLALLSRSTWVQLIRRIDGVSAPWFGIDEAAALRVAAAHLIAFGHRRIGYIGGTQTLSTGRQRLAGFRQAFTEAGLPFPEDIVRTGPPRPPFAAQAFDEIWAAAQRPTALVAAGARLTAGALERIGALGLRVPGDLSVVGYGDVPWWSTGLSSVALPTREVAMACADHLLRRLADAGTESRPAGGAAYAASFVARASTALAPGPAAKRARRSRNDEAR
jgi:LacI family transcriptional regulator